MNSRIQREGSDKLLSLRKSDTVLSTQATDESTDKTVDSELVRTTINGDYSKKPSITPIFEPLEEEGERYLREHMRLPPIDLTTMPTRYYINPHPTDSIMSSSANSANEWWYKVDYSDEEVDELECDRERRVIKTVRKYSKRDDKEGDNQPEHPVGLRTFPKTTEMQKERQAREQEEKETDRAEIISKLEKQMVSLYNLKRQYRRTLGGEGCPRARTSLPPLVAGDKLARQRDSLISRIKRKKLEEEMKRKNQIERKLSIVKTLLNEQKQRENELRRKFQERTELTQIKSKKPKKEISSILLAESEDTPDEDDVESTEVAPTEELTADGTDFVEGTEEIKIPPDELSPSVDDQQEFQTSPRKSSQIKNAPKKKSAEAPTKQGGKSKKKDKKKDAEVEEAPATCEPTLEPPASQMAELSLWIENWRENVQEQNRLLKEYEDQQLQVEDEVVLKPTKVVFKDVVAGQRVQQVVVVTNVGLGALQCRVMGVQQPTLTENSPFFQTAVSGPSKARTGHSWSVTVTLDTQEEVEDTSAELVILFCREEVRTRLGVEVQVLTPRAEPTLSTNTIRFGHQMFWSRGPFTKDLHIANPGGLGCSVYWSEVVDPIPLSISTIRVNRESGEEIEDEEKKESAEVKERKTSTKYMKSILYTVFKHVFRVFRIETRQPLILPPKSQVSLPVRFNPTLSEVRGYVFAKYRFSFEGENLENETQELVVRGRIDRSPFRLEYEVVNMKLCYVGGNVQQARLVVHSSARHACRVAPRVPRSLASVVSVVPRTAMVEAKSYVTMIVRLVLGWNFLEKPSRYLDTAGGLLMFPITVWVTDVGLPGVPPLDATVVASVAPTCPLTLEHPVVELGNVSTMETVEAEVALTNHCPRTYNYAFVDLPAGIMIEPGGGTGSVLPLETVKLKLFYSPRAEDLGVECGQPGGEGEVRFTLRCFTTISLASPIQRQVPRKEQSAKNILNNSRISSKYTVSMNTTLHSSKNVSLSETQQISSKEDQHDKKVNFEEGAAKDVSEESFVYVPINDEMDQDEVVGVEEYDEHYLTISEMKEQENEFNTENLWDFYSAFQFDKSSKEDKSEVIVEEEREQGEVNDEVLSENKSIVSEDEENMSNRNSEKGRKRESVNNRQETAIKESVSETEGSKGNKCSFEKEINFRVDEVESDSENDSGSEPKKVEEDSKDVVQLPETTQRFAALSIKAYVVDPLVELSHQSVILPPTPCTSFTTAQIYLRSRQQIQCGMHDKITKFKTRFEFQSPSEDLIIEPKQGYIGYKQSQKINLIYSPKMSKEEISVKALQMKLENLKWKKIQDLLDEYYKSKENKQLKGKREDKSARKQSDKEGKLDGKSQFDDGKSKKAKGKKSKGSVVSVKTKKAKEPLKSSKLKKKSSGALPEITINPEEVEVTEEDVKEAELSLLRYLEPYDETLTVLCLLETDMGNGNRRQEMLRCEVLCTVVAPNIFLNSPPCLDFGPVAIGACSRLEATITNLSFFDAFVRLSTLNPVGPFVCPAHLEYPFLKNGELELPPEHILTVPVLFRPSKSEEVVEAFEVISGSTVLHLQARGLGVSPSFSFQPDREVFMVTSAAGKKADITISISNTCEAPLTFRISQEYLKEGQSLPTPKTEESSPEATSPKQKKDAKKGKKGKGLPEFTMLSEELDKCLENDFVTIDNVTTTEPMFKILNNDENITVLTGEIKQVIIRFTPPVVKQEMNLNSPKSAKSTEGNQKGMTKKAKKKSNDKQETVTVDTKLDKKGGKKKKSLTGKGEKKESLSVKSERKDDVKIKQIFAAKFNVIFADVHRVKNWVLLGTKK